MGALERGSFRNAVRAVGRDGFSGHLSCRQPGGSITASALATFCMLLGGLLDTQGPCRGAAGRVAGPVPGGAVSRFDNSVDRKRNSSMALTHLAPFRSCVGHFGTRNPTYLCMSRCLGAGGGAGWRGFGRFRRGDAEVGCCELRDASRQEISDSQEVSSSETSGMLKSTSSHLNHASLCISMHFCLPLSEDESWDELSLEPPQELAEQSKDLARCFVRLRRLVLRETSERQDTWDSTRSEESLESLEPLESEPRRGLRGRLSRPGREKRQMRGSYAAKDVDIACRSAVVPGRALRGPGRETNFSLRRGSLCEATSTARMGKRRRVRTTGMPS